MKSEYSTKIFFILLLMYLFVGYSRLQQDDAYIFYTYAKNIAEGNGYVYNPGERINATTSALYTILLASVYFPVKNFFPDSLPYIALLIGFISLCFLIFIVQKILSGNKIASFMFPLLFMANPLLKFGIGMETYLNLVMITAAIFYYYKRRLIITSVFCALAVLARLDSVILPVVILLYHLFKEKEPLPFKAIAVFILILLPWFLFSYIYFDSILPTTVYIKLNQSKLGFFGSGLIFIKGLFNSVPGTRITGTMILISVLLTTVYFTITKKFSEQNKGIILILLWGLVLFITYAFILNAPPYPWYYSPFSLPVSVLLSVLLGELLADKKKFLTYSFAALLLLTTLILPTKTFLEGYNSKYIYYIRATEWLNKNAGENSLLAVDEIGIIGYYYEKGKIIDMLGIITPDIMEMQLRGNQAGYIDKYRPDYILTDYPHAPIHTGMNDSRFRDNYKKVWQTEAENQFIAIFKKK